jgi:hypothetical protein
MYRRHPAGLLQVLGDDFAEDVGLGKTLGTDRDGIASRRRECQ